MKQVYLLLVCIFLFAAGCSSTPSVIETLPPTSAPALLPTIPPASPLPSAAASAVPPSIVGGNPTPTSIGPASRTITGSINPTVVAPATPGTAIPITPTRPLNPTNAPATLPLASATGGAWKPYTSPQGGYTVEIPAAWKITEQAGKDQTVVTLFSPAEGAGIQIVVAPARDNGPADIPNVRCQAVTVAGRVGQRCFDTIAMSLTTTLTQGGKTYLIASAGKAFDQGVYDRVLNSLKIF